ncbi:MAG: hypothetical protein M1828_004495 [Chrysothrix sp. TS-e1954]|nr:MAG: hypothetical protein M1828_004495 [Chrysothrix sp. TS-e1954]
MSSTEQDPGLITGHAQYAKGAAVETIGSVSGSDAWKDSGAEQKQAGLDEMKAAGEARKEDGGGGYGKAEEMAGKAVGCEGMEKEGEETKTG